MEESHAPVWHPRSLLGRQGTKDMLTLSFRKVRHQVDKAPRKSQDNLLVILDARRPQLGKQQHPQQQRADDIDRDSHLVPLGQGEPALIHIHARVADNRVQPLQLGLCPRGKGPYARVQREVERPHLHHVAEVEALGKGGPDRGCCGLALGGAADREDDARGVQAHEVAGCF